MGNPSNLAPLVRRALRRSQAESSTAKYAAMSNKEKRPPKRVPSIKDYSKPIGLARNLGLCEGGVNVSSLWDRPCPKCGATEDDKCQYETTN